MLALSSTEKRTAQKEKKFSTIEKSAAAFIEIFPKFSLVP
jgi:hypothetical protein